MANDQNTWSEYSRLVIAELERLNDGISKLNNEIQDLKRQIVELKVKEDNVKELKKWKDLMDDVTSPTQLKDVIKDVTELKTFKTQAVTVWVVVQILFGIVMALLNYFK
jgi:predicted  nucleic acid-binding Zn-ribbon protein